MHQHPNQHTQPKTRWARSSYRGKSGPRNRASRRGRSTNGWTYFRLVVTEGTATHRLVLSGDLPKTKTSCGAIQSSALVSTRGNRRKDQIIFFGKELSTRDCSLSEAELNSGSSQEAQCWRAHVEWTKTLTAEVKRKRAQRMVIARVECKMKRIYTQPRLGQVAWHVGGI